VPASTVPRVIGWPKASFSAENLREMAGIGAALVKGDSRKAFLELNGKPNRRFPI
jgi:hypothetical protein